jgi:hypothetical protein
MKHYFPKLPVETGGKPALFPHCNRHRPVNDGVALIIFTAKARKIKCTASSPARKKIRTHLF